MAAFRGMYVSPAKHSYVWLPRKCDRWTDRQMDGQTDDGQSDPYVPLCFAGDIKMNTVKNRHDEKPPFIFLKIVIIWHNKNITNPPEVNFDENSWSQNILIYDITVTLHFLHIHYRNSWHVQSDFNNLNRTGT